MILLCGNNKVFLINNKVLLLVVVALIGIIIMLVFWYFGVWYMNAHHNYVSILVSDMCRVVLIHTPSFVPELEAIKLDYHLRGCGEKNNFLMQFC